MAKKEENIVQVKDLEIEKLKETTCRIKIVGDTDLMLHARSRYYVLSEVWKQEHDKGAKMPEVFCQSKNPWENLITSIHWKDPIVFHDDDISLYTEDEWDDYMKNNVPCILSMAFKKSFSETFISFFKETTGKAGTDFQRSVVVSGNTIGKNDLIPVNFSEVRIEKSIVPTKGLGGSTVVCSANVFSGWSCEFDVTTADIVFPAETVLNIISNTGKYIGIGSQHKNGYGRYHVESAMQMN